MAEPKTGSDRARQKAAASRLYHESRRAWFIGYSRLCRRKHLREIEAYDKKYYTEHKDYFRQKKKEYWKDKRKRAQKGAYNRELKRPWSEGMRRQKKQAAR